MAEERTFIAIKPDAVERRFVGEIIGRFEKRGYKLVALKMLKPSVALLEQHYEDLKGKPFFNGLVQYMASGPVVAMVWEGWLLLVLVFGVFIAIVCDYSKIYGLFEVKIYFSCRFWHDNALWQRNRLFSAHRRGTILNFWNIDVFNFQVFTDKEGTTPTRNFWYSALM